MSSAPPTARRVRFPHDFQRRDCAVLGKVMETTVKQQQNEQQQQPSIVVAFPLIAIATTTTNTDNKKPNTATAAWTFPSNNKPIVTVSDLLRFARETLASFPHKKKDKKIDTTSSAPLSQSSSAASYSSASSNNKANKDDDDDYVSPFRAYYHDVSCTSLKARLLSRDKK